MRAKAWAMGAMAWLLVGAGVANAEPASYPTSFEREPMLVWLQRETDIQPSQVIAITPQALTSLVSTFPAGAGQGPRVVIRAEALSEEIHVRSGAMSWHVSLTADCAARRVRLGETTGYQARNLLGERKILRAAETDWRVPEPGTALEHAWRAACERNFAGPFMSSAVRLAQADAAVAPPAPDMPPKAKSAVSQVAPGRVSEPSTPNLPVPIPPAKKPVAVKPSPFQTASRPQNSGVAAQVGSGPSQVEARRLLNALGGTLQGRKTWIEPAEVAGRVWHRAMVGGFSSSADASAFCAELKEKGRACFVRQARAG